MCGRRRYVLETLSQYKNLPEFGQVTCLRGKTYKLSAYSHLRLLLVIKTSDYSLTENVSSSCSCLVYRGLPEPSTVKSPFAQSSVVVLNYKRVDSERGKKFFIMRMLRHWHRLPRELPHPWKHSRPGSTGLCAA